MKDYPIILSIAGSDCSGGAGIQADIKTISALGGYAATVITAITVQNTLGVQTIHTLPPEIVGGQIKAVTSDLRPDAIKIGMVDNAAIVQVIAECMREYGTYPIVYDPVMASTSGRKLMTDAAIEEIKHILLPQVSLITPNMDEASLLTGKTLRTIEEMKQAAMELSEIFGTSVLVKGGHLQGNEMCDVLCTSEKDIYMYKVEKIESRNLHGTGCTLSSAIATYLAKKYPVNEAVGLAKNYVNSAIAAGKELHIGQGNGPLWHFPNQMAGKCG